MFSPITAARRTDPSTSHAAAASAATFAASQHQQILGVLRGCRSAVTLGAEQIGDILNLPAYAIRKRLAELGRASLIEPIPGSSRKTRSGRTERLWRAL